MFSYEVTKTASSTSTLEDIELEKDFKAYYEFDGYDESDNDLEYYFIYSSRNLDDAIAALEGVTLIDKYEF